MINPTRGGGWGAGGGGEEGTPEKMTNRDLKIILAVGWSVGVGSSRSSSGPDFFQVSMPS